MITKWYWEDTGFGTHELSVDCTSPLGSDSMAEIRSLDGNNWRVRWWARPQAPETRQEIEFTGTLEEAKAYATALARMQ